MADVAELIDQGIKAYVSGRVGEALRSFQQVLEVDPGNPRARSYLLLIHGGATGLVPEKPAPVPLPGGAVAPVPTTAPPARPATPVPLPQAGTHPAATRIEDFAPSPWDEGPAAAATFVLEPGGGLD